MRPLPWKSENCTTAPLCPNVYKRTIKLKTVHTHTTLVQNDNENQALATLHQCLVDLVALWPGGGNSGSSNCSFSAKSKNFRKIFFLSENSRRKNTKFDAKTLLGKLKDKLEIMSTHNLLCRNFAVSARQSQISAPLLFNLCVDRLR